MNWKKTIRVIVALFLAVCVAVFMWMILGAAGYSRMGWLGAEIAIVPPIITGVVLFLILNWLFKQLYE